MSLLLERANALISIRRYSQAADLLSRHLATAPDDSTALTSLAIARLHLEDASGALEAANRAAALAPDDAAPHRARSYAHYLAGDMTAAVAAARESVRLSPDSWESHALLASMLCEPWVHSRRRARGPGLAEAATAAARAVALAPDEAQAHAAMGRLSLARGDLAGAEAAYGAALALEPDLARAQSDLALARARAGSVRASARGYVASAAADPRDPTAAYNVRGLVWLMLGRLAGVLCVLALLATALGGVLLDIVAPAGLAAAIGAVLVVVRRLPSPARLLVVRMARRGWGTISVSAVCAAGVLMALAPWQRAQSSSRIITGVAAVLSLAGYLAVVKAVSADTREFDDKYGAGAVTR